MTNHRKYNVILMDAPWRYNSRANHKTRFRGGAEGHYPLMSMEEIKALPVADLAADNCALFFWTTPPFVNEQLKLLKHYGFRFATKAYCWVKLNPKGYATPQKDPGFTADKTYVLYPGDGLYHSIFFGVGYYPKSNSEDCYLAIKGKMKPLINNQSQMVLAPRREHSRKPDEVIERIEKLYGDVPRLEMFSRNPRPGWDVLGNGVDGVDVRDTISIVGAKAMLNEKHIATYDQIVHTEYLTREEFNARYQLTPEQCFVKSPHAGTGDLSPSQTFLFNEI